MKENQKEKAAFKVELQDFWVYEEEVNHALKQRLIRDIVNGITKEENAQIIKEVKKEAGEMVRQSYQLRVHEVIKEIVDNEEKIFDGKSLKDFIVNKIQRGRGYDNVKEHISSFCERFTKNLKKQYDLSFAAQIVNKMSENGLLKNDELTKLLK